MASSRAAKRASFVSRELLYACVAYIRMGSVWDCRVKGEKSGVDRSKSQSRLDWIFVIDIFE